MHQHDAKVWRGFGVAITYNPDLPINKMGLISKSRKDHKKNGYNN